MRLEDLLTVPPQGRHSWLDKLRSGPVRVSSRALVRAIHRLQSVRDLGIRLPATGIPSSRLASLARFAGTAKITVIRRLPPVRRLAILVAFIHCLEATAQDDAIKVGVMDGLPGLEKVFREEFAGAVTARCWFHASQNILAKTPKRLYEPLASMLKRVMYADGHEQPWMPIAP